VFVVLAFHLETADDKHLETATDNATVLRDALLTVRRREGLADELVYLTVDQAAELARFRVAPLAGPG
jgi:hypothetical protein